MEEPDVTTIAETKTWSMSELRAHQGSLFIRNNTPLLWTLHENVGNGQRIDIELKGNGQPGSICYLPPSALDAPGVARNFYAGKVTVSPDLEPEMLELAGAKISMDKKVLAEFQVELTESPHARAIDSREQYDAAMEQLNRRRAVTTQGAQGSKSTIDEFINPSPLKADDGRLISAITGEVIGKAPEAPQIVGDHDPLASTMLGQVQVTHTHTVPEGN
jgi:hypothetical protein